MSNIQLTKSSSESDLKRYFAAVLELSKADNKFPINLDEVWPLVYAERGKATKSLRKNFFENEDFITIAQTGKGGQFDKIDYFLSLSCMEYFIARKVRPVFEVYRQVFHKTAQQQLPQTYKQALEQLLQQVEENERLQLENSAMMPKARIYDQVIQSPQTEWLSTTTSVANEIGMSGQKLNQMLVACGIIYKSPSGEYLFTSEYLRWKLGQTVSCVIDQEKGKIKTYIKWNTRGRAYIHALNDTNWDKRRAWHYIRRGKEVAV